MDTQVIVVGAGPAGLMLAGELRLWGVDVVVLERLPQPGRESRGLGFTARTMEVLDQRGLLPRYGKIETRDFGHFGGLPLDFGVVSGAHFGAKGVPQSRTEAMLADWATELGAGIWRGRELVGLYDNGDGVAADVTGPAGIERLDASFLVGCDGGRSTVRKAAGFDFPGTASTIEMILADVKDCDIRLRILGEAVPGGMVMASPLEDDVVRIFVCERDARPQARGTPPTFAEVADAWLRLTGEDIHAATPVWVSTFGDATRQVTEYRRSRVLLAGDAAHIQVPAGGQGLNVAIQDSVNLGWKLAATVQGWAPTGLLDTYHSERHPVGARLLMNTRAQGILMLGGDEVQPIRDLLTELVGLDVVSRHLVGMLSGLDIRYDVGPGEHPLLGRRMPHRELFDGANRTSTTELLHPGRAVLLDLVDSAELRRVAAGWADRLQVSTAVPYAVEADDQLANTDAVLVRPDGHVAWAAPGGGELSTALRRWLGAARDG